jgi:dihydrodipicolinate synthase/N-acetylneuraminate lyase
MPVIAGCGTRSTGETVQFCQEASSSSASYALILLASYCRSILSTELIIQYFGDVVDGSPIPVLVHKFSAVCGGLDLSSGTILALSEHRNIVDGKLTCGYTDTGKLARIAAGTRDGFLTMGASVDFMMQTLIVGGKGIVERLANLAPKSLCEGYGVVSFQQGKLDEATKIQEVDSYLR